MLLWARDSHSPVGPRANPFLSLSLSLLIWEPGIMVILALRGRG